MGCEALRQCRPALCELIDQEVFGSARDSHDLDRLLQLAAALDSADYYEEHMHSAVRAETAAALLQRCFERRRLPGLILEFGVASGSSIDLLAGLTEETIFGFDSFAGLPEHWRPGFPQGSFAAERPAVLPNVTLVVGLFDQTLPQFAAEHRHAQASFIHVDCDLYSSTRTIFTHCAQLIGPGTVIVFDEYFNYPGWRRHEYRAFQEFAAEAGHGYEYLGVVPSGQQVAVVITG
jgi:predicted O-methyltransferase YrrM